MEEDTYVEEPGELEAPEVTIEEDRQQDDPVRVPTSTPVPQTTQNNDIAVNGNGEIVLPEIPIK